MQRLAVGDGLVHGTSQRRIIEERTVLDRLVDAGEALVHHPAGAQVHMAHFGIAHLSVRQANLDTGGGKQGVRAVLPQPVPDGGGGSSYRVVGGIFAMSPAIQDQ